MRLTHLLRLSSPFHHRAVAPVSARPWLYAAVFTGLLSTQAFAQTRPNEPFGEGEVEEAEFEIVQSRENELPPANRRFQKVPETTRPVENKVQDYQFSTFRISNLPNLEPRLRVKTLPKEPLNKLYGNYIKVGVGNYATTYAEGFFNSKRTENYQYGAHIRHLASARGPVNKSYSGSGENMVKLYGNMFGKKATLGGTFGYTRERYNFYGFAPEAELPDDSVKQVFNTVEVGVNLKNNDTDAALDYQAEVRFGRIADFLAARESELNVDLKTTYDLQSGSTILVDVETSFTQRQDEATEQNRNWVMVRPAYRYFNNGFLITLGANIGYENDTIGDSDLHLYPRANIEYALLPEKLTAFAGLNGELEKTTLRTVVAENPFLAPNVELRHANKRFDVYGGIRGQVVSRLAYQVQASFRNYKNYHYYLNSPSDTAKFNLVYDGDGGTTLFNLSTQLTYEPLPKLQLGWKADAYAYSPGELEEPWHRPAFTTGVTVRYNVMDKVLLSTDVFYNSAIFARNPTTDAIVKLDGMLDWDARAEYLLSERASIFLSLDNLINQQNQRFLYYPTRGRMIMFGGTYSF
ncbi:hypothetical protein SAMN05421823_11215 [Catalinimonas alkaloidigena]|uniref:TonB dependent receptor n=1 Tax=Catalinimonas alkaloidigena TaxID=1075417 RepID=A0A1G9S3T5_9BACT|nr:TonB-dependent receptor [Catalinimonas alkaloidigena]SDM29937.1 hypothetical protein SAMN05421823_11215 [Catalinimonas alkaloidigena]